MNLGQKRPQRRTRWTRRIWSKRRSCKCIPLFLLDCSDLCSHFVMELPELYVIWRGFHNPRWCNALQVVCHVPGVLNSLDADGLLGSRCLNLKSPPCSLCFIHVFVFTMGNITPFGATQSSLLVPTWQRHFWITWSHENPLHWLLVSNL